jgi:hypothetical protein
MKHARKRKKKTIEDFRWRNVNERDHLVDRLRWKGNNKMDVKQIGLECMDWIQLASNRDQWRAALNMAMPFQFL